MLDLTIKGEIPGSDIIIQLSLLRLTSLIFLSIPCRKLPKLLFIMKVAILLAVLAVSSAQYVYPGVGAGYPGVYPGQQVLGYPSTYGGYYPGSPFGYGYGYNAKSVVVSPAARPSVVAKTIPTQVKYVAQQPSAYATYPYGGVSQYAAYPTVGQVGGVAHGIGQNGVHFSSPSYEYSY